MEETQAMVGNVADRFDSDDGPVYRSDVSGDLFVVESRPSGFSDNAQVEIRRVTDAEWYGVYQDNFRSGYAKVSDTVGGLTEGDF